MSDAKVDVTPRTPEESGARIATVRKEIQSIDDQAAVFAEEITAALGSLADLAAQRQPLVDEMNAIMNELVAAPWRDVLRAAGSSTVP